MTKQNQLIDFIRSLQLEERAQFIKSLSKIEKKYVVKLVYADPYIFLFEKQKIPDSVQSRYIILRCGRRFGKSVAGSAFIAKKLLAGAKQVGCAGAKHEDVWKVMIPNILNWFPPQVIKQTNINRQNHVVTFPNGSQIHTFTSDAENRGMSLEYLWCDEVGSWCDSIPAKVKNRFDIIDTAVSVGEYPQTIITSTPKPFPLYLDWQKEINKSNPNYHLITGNMEDNPFLSKAYKETEYNKYINQGAYGRQEYYGNLEIDIEGALWNRNVILYISNQSEFRRIVIAVDPAVSTNSKSDETGIIIAGLTFSNQIIILADHSGKYTPNQWANLVNNLYKTYKADRIIVEKNQGGDLVTNNLKTVNSHLPIKAIHATKGKILRAEPVAALYEQSKVFHIKEFTQLEEEMCFYTGATNDKSPNRLDALVYACSELLLETQYIRRNIAYLPNLS